MPAWILVAVLAFQGELELELPSVLSRAVDAERNGDLEAAAAAYRDAVALEPGSAALYFSLGAAEARLGRLTRALAALERAVELEPGDARYALARGALLRELGNEEGAAAAFERVIETSPASKAAHLELADLYQSTREFARAAAVLERWLAEHPGDLEVLYFLGTLHVYQNQFDEALDAFAAVLAEEPDHARALSRRAHVLAQRPETMAEAAVSFQRSLELDPEQPYVWYEYGALLGKLGEVQDGMVAIERSLELDPEQAEALYALGNLATRAGREDEARRYLERFKAARDRESQSSADAKRALALFARGRELLEANRLDEAIDVFLQVTELDPKSHQAYAFLAKGYFSRGEPALAMGYIRRAMTLSPGTAEYPYVLSLCLRGLGNFPAAIDAISEAAVLAGADPFLANARGVLLREAGELELSVEAHERALALDPENPVYLLNLAGALDDVGRSDEASAIRERYRALMGLR